MLDTEQSTNFPPTSFCLDREGHEEGGDDDAKS